MIDSGGIKMKIEDKRNNARKFSELVVGDVFVNSAGFYYMKTEKRYDENGTIELNAVHLSGDYVGTAMYFRPDEKVILLDNVTLVLN